MKLNNTIKSHSEYLNGISDVFQHSSFKSTLKGIGKIISYIFIIPPLISLSLCKHYKKIVAFQNEGDRSIDNDTHQTSIKSLFDKLFDKNPKSQQKIIDYLITKIENFEKNDLEDIEKGRFAKGFKKLSFESQKNFFQQVNSHNCMELALEWIPRDIEKLNFYPGYSDFIYYEQKCANNVSLIAKILPEFKNLNELSLNLKCLGHHHKMHDVWNILNGKRNTNLEHYFYTTAEPYEPNVLGEVQRYYEKPLFDIVKSLQILIKGYKEINKRMKYSIVFEKVNFTDSV